MAHSPSGDSSANRRRRLCAWGCRDHFRWLGGAGSRHGGRDLVFLGWGDPWWSLGVSQGLLTLRRPSGSGQEGEWVTGVVQAESVKVKRTIFLMVARRAKETPCRTMPLLQGCSLEVPVGLYSGRWCPSHRSLPAPGVPVVGGVCGKGHHHLRCQRHGDPATLHLLQLLWLREPTLLVVLQQQ